MHKLTRALLTFVLFFIPALVFSQPSNIYTFYGDVDLGIPYVYFTSSGQHYIGAKGDTVYVITSNGWTWCSKSTDGGQTFGPPVRVNSTGAGYNPSMRVDTAGVVYTAYQDEFADIRFTKSTDGGMTFTPGLKVNDDTIPQVGQEKPAIAVNNKGQIFIAWRDQRNSVPQTHQTIFASASYDGGQTFTPNVQVNDSSTPIGVGLDIAASDNGAVYVAWGSYYDTLYVSRSNDSGQWFYLRTPVSTAVYKLSLAIVDSIVGVVWDFVGNAAVRFSVSYDCGQTFSPSVVVNNESLTYNSIPSLVFKNGVFFVSWSGERLGRFRDIYFSYSSDTGRTFVVSKQANSDTLTNAVSSSLAVNCGDKAFVVWQDPRRDPWYGEDWHSFVAIGNPIYVKGDLNLDLILSIADVVTLINAVFLNSSFPAPFENADVNCDGVLRPVDVVLELQAVFLEHNFPC